MPHPTGLKVRCSMELRLRRIAGAAGLLYLLLFGAAACDGQEAEDIAAEDIAEGEAMPEKPIEAVLKEHTDSLMVLPGVVATGQGECGGAPCIRVFVVQKTSAVVDKIPSMLGGYTVDVVVTGKIKALEQE